MNNLLNNKSSSKNRLWDFSTLNRQQLYSKLSSLLQDYIFENTSFFNPKLIETIVSDEFNSLRLFFDQSDPAISKQRGRLSARLGLSVKTILAMMNIIFDEFSQDMDSFEQSKLNKIIEQYYVEYLQAFLEKREEMIGFQKGKVYETLLDTLKAQRIQVEELKKQSLQDKLNFMGKIIRSIAKDFDEFINSTMGSLSYAELSANLDSECFYHLRKAVLQCLKARVFTNQLNSLFINSQFNFEESSLKELIDVTMALLKVDDKYHIHRVMEPGLPDVSIDRNRMIQVLYNLLLNSMESMPEGGSVELSFSQNRKSYAVEFRIKDHGIGIAAENLTQIFLPFYSTKSNHRGLGLFICQSIIQKHLGKIQIHSKPGKGTVVLVKIPFGKSALSNKMSNEG